MRKSEVEQPDYAAMATAGHFSKAEVRRMYQRYLSIAYCPDASQPHDAWLTREAFLQQPELSFCPLAGRAFDVEAAERATNGYIDFSAFIYILSIFSPKASLDEKKLCNNCLFLSLTLFLTICSQFVADLRKLLGAVDGTPPSKESYARYISDISSGTILPHIAESIAEEVWGNLTVDFAGQPFAPSGSYDIDVLMTIPL